MIVSDYKIERDEKDEIKIFRPFEEIKNIDNIVKIEGPNSIGKSTLLHILAYGCYGLEQKTLPESLQDKLNNLFDSKRNKITYKIVITNQDKSLKLTLGKSDPKAHPTLIEEINGKKNALSVETFQRKYNLIYDIPNDPIQRLKQVSYEIKESQSTYGSNVEELKQCIGNLIADIIKNKSPEEREKIKQGILSLEKENEKLQKVNIELNEKHDALEKAYALAQYNRAAEELHKFEAIRKELGGQKKAVFKKTTKLIEYRQTLKTMVDETDVRFSSLLPILKVLFKDDADAKSEHSKLKSIDLNEILYEFKIDKKLLPILRFFEDKLFILSEKDKGKKDIEYDFYVKLADFLNYYKNSNIKIPGAKTSIFEILRELNSKIEMEKEKNIYITNLNTAKTLVNQLITDVSEIDGLVAKMSSDEIKDLGSGIDESAMVSAEKNVAIWEKEYKKSSVFYEEKGKPDEEIIAKLSKTILRKYMSYTPNDMHKEIETIESKIASNNAQIGANEIRIREDRNEINDLESKKTPKYYDKYDKLNKWHDISRGLETKLRHTFQGYISELTVPRKVKKQFTPEQEKYYENVYKYIGNRINYILYQDEELKVIKIDLLNKVITVKKKGKEKEKELTFDDISTGQSQSIYFRNKLNVPKSDKRIIIALFDEMAMMDKRSMQPILEKIRSLYKEKRLLIGILVKFNEKINVEGLGK